MPDTPNAESVVIRQYGCAVTDDELVVLWNEDWRGAPDLSQPPPRINGYETRWVTRTVTYSPWEPVQIRSGTAGPEVPGA